MICYRRLPAGFATECEMKLEPQLIAAKYLPEIQIHSPCCYGKQLILCNNDEGDLRQCEQFRFEIDCITQGKRKAQSAAVQVRSTSSRTIN